MSSVWLTTATVAEASPPSEPSPKSKWPSSSTSDWFTFSPNLNLIERVWKFVKKKTLANRNFADFRSFQNAIKDVLDGLDTTFQAQMATLPTHNFETLNRPPVCTV